MPHFTNPFSISLRESKMRTKARGLQVNQEDLEVRGDQQLQKHPMEKNKLNEKSLFRLFAGLSGFNDTQKETFFIIEWKQNWKHHDWQLNCGCLSKHTAKNQGNSSFYSFKQQPVMRWVLFCTRRYYFCHVCKIPKLFLQSLQGYGEDWKTGLKIGLAFFRCCAWNKKKKKKEIAIQSSQDVVWVPNQSCLHRVSHKHRLILFYTFFKLISTKKKHWCSGCTYLFICIQFYGVKLV